MDRRAFLAAGTGLALGASGCLGGGDGGTPPGDPDDPDPDDGYPPPLGSTPTRRDVDPGSFATVDRDGVAVPLAPVEVAHYWFSSRGARFVDARGRSQYDDSHVYGAVWSPAPDGRADDPVADWPAGDRVVAYCGCPHHLSSMRAATMLRNGYERVYVVDEGFWEWHDRGYPMAGTDVEAAPRLRVVRGRADPAFAGETAWAVHEPTDQREAAPIADDGSYRLELRFAGLSDADAVVVRTPGYEVEAPLAELTEGIVTGDGVR